jgi:hypothetical protein
LFLDFNTLGRGAFTPLLAAAATFVAVLVTSVLSKTSQMATLYRKVTL